MEQRCRHCLFFVTDPLALEQELPGLRILSSAFGSVRGDTGLCREQQVMTVGRASCGRFVPVPPNRADVL